MIPHYCPIEHDEVFVIEGRECPNRCGFVAVDELSLARAMRLVEAITGKTVVYDGTDVYTVDHPLHRCADGRLVPLQPGVICADCGTRGTL